MDLSREAMIVDTEIRVREHRIEAFQLMDEVSKESRIDRMAVANLLVAAERSHVFDEACALIREKVADRGAELTPGLLFELYRELAITPQGK